MSAQYRPYRDEESVDGLETASWTDNEPGSIQIYEKTTEELPFSANKKALWIQIALFSLTGILGFLLGYFGPFHRADLLINNEGGVHLNGDAHYSELFEDPTIKEKLLNQIDGQNILAILEKFRNTKRSPGSEGDHELVAYIKNLFIEYGIDSVTPLNYTFKTMSPRQSSIVKILDKDNVTIHSTNHLDGKSLNLSTKLTLDEAEPFLPLSQAEQTIITTNQLLYLNRGLKDDYAKLPSLGVNETKGKIFVIRQTFYQTHEVVMNAQILGATAILFFPDPDTYGSNSPFPHSVQLPNDAARSHPLVWSSYGDLASLNMPLINNTDLNLLGSEKESKARIPVILISYNTARSILIGLAGLQAPSDWNCFDFTLHLGPGYREENSLDGRSSISIEFYNQETTLTTTTLTGTIAGAAEPDRYVIIGSRRDSLTDGILDSLSGTAVMLEIARVYGALLKNGWRPRRTIVFNSFGAESFNLLGSNSWLEAHEKLVYSRAVSYINCDLIVAGNKSITVSASPLLYQVIYNATKQVRDPNSSGNIYSNWVESHSYTKLEEAAANRLASIHELDKLLFGDRELPSINDSTGTTIKSTPTISISTNESEDNSDNLGYQGDILKEYKKSATVVSRPRIRRLDMQSIYSPFCLHAGIPVVDVRYTGFHGISSKSTLLEDTLPIIGSKYDNMAALSIIDPYLKYHVAVTQILSEILRDLSDSVFLPYNLLDYAVTLADSYVHLATHFGKTFEDSNLDLVDLKRVIHEFTISAAKFHQRQDQVNLKDALQVRRFNDQMMLLERAFLDPNGLPDHHERKHLILAAHDGQEQKGGFPGLVDWMTLLDGESLDSKDYEIFIAILQMHYKVVVYTISNAIKIIDDVHII